MNRRPRRMDLQLETMEPRELLSGLTPAGKMETNLLAGRILADALNRATAHDVSDVDARQRVLLARSERIAQHALKRLQGNPHASVLAGRLHSGDASSNASPSWTSSIFANFAKFSFRAFNTNTDLLAQIKPGTNTFDGFPNLTLTVTPYPVNDNFGSEVLDLNFQYNKELLKIRQNGAREPDHLTFGPIGAGGISPVRIPVQKTVMVTRLYMYFTINNVAEPSIKQWGNYIKGTDPLNPSRQVFSLVGGLPFQVNAGGSFYMLNGNYTLTPSNFAAMGVSDKVNGMHIDIMVTPVSPRSK